MTMIEPVQLQLIHIAKKQCGLDDIVYREIIAAQTKGKKSSSKDLTYFEADAVINYMVRQGFKIKEKFTQRERDSKRRWRSGQRPANVVCLPSRDQLNMIDALASKIAWKFEDGFFRWMKKYHKTDRIITGKQAEAVIEGLKKMLDHQARRDRSPIDPHVSPDNPDDGALGDRALQNIEE